MVIDVVSLKLRARRAYELGRLRRALAWSIPTLLLAAVVVALVHEVSLPLLLGLALYLASVVLLWWGRSPGRSVLPGVVYGLLPLAGAVIAKLHGHMCMGATCYGMCVPLCVGGGAVAGLLVARLAARSETPAPVFLSAASTALLTGAIGGSCVGLHGLVGMALGIGAGVLPLLVVQRLRPRLSGTP
jgi:hypothetical protein